MEQILNFSVDSALLQELGEKLVETVHVALAELVKNSYDADASTVSIIFKQDAKGAPEIHIVDDGKGMNLASIQKYWMRIATTNKGKSQTSQIYGRPLTGAKGIGRFSCRRLGGKLKLISKSTPKGDKVGLQPKLTCTTVEFPWKTFKPGTDVTEIVCKGDVSDVINEATGTTLIISDVSDEWNTHGWNWLKRQLAVLAVNTGAKREGYSEDPGFNITIVSSDSDSDYRVRDLRQDYINSGWGTLRAYINEDKQAVCEIDAKDIGFRRIISGKSFPDLNDVSLNIGIIVAERDQMRDTSNVSMSNALRILPEWGGVQIRYRNFRVFPYGDDDWLDIDRDRGLRRSQSRENELVEFASTLRGVDPSTSLLTMLSMRSYLGSVFIGEEATGFEMKLSREGFVETPAFRQLKEFTRFAIDWSTILHDFYKRETSVKKSLIAVRHFEEIIKEKLEPARYINAAVDYIEKETGAIVETLPEDVRKGIALSLTRATDVIRTTNQSTQNELAHLRLVASTSTLLLIFSHEVKSLLGLLENSRNSLTAIGETLSQRDKKNVEKITGGFTDLRDRLEELLEMTSLVGAAARKAKAGRVALKTKIEKVEKVFSLVINKYDIEFDYEEVPTAIILTEILEAEVYSILLNTLSNSIKSVIAKGLDRKIEISASRSNGLTHIVIRDNGLGMDPEDFETVFIPFSSDPKGQLYSSLDRHLNPEDRIMVGSGSGLGLGIVKEIVNARNGEIEFVTPALGWKAQLEIKLP